MWILVLQRIFLEFLFDLAYFPLWWYTGGVARAVKFCYGWWQAGNRRLSPGLWLKNLLVPMFGQSDWQGRLVSIFIRLANVIIRSFGLLVWSIVVLAIFLLWLAFPVFIVWRLLNSL